MTEESKQPTPNESGEQKSLSSELLRGVGHTIVPIIVTAGGLLGFVALAGSAIVWTRFSAAGIPPDQVVAIYPRQELVAIASALLLIFGLVGLIAVAMCYLIEPKGRASLGMTRCLLTVMGAEGLAVILFITEPTSPQQRIIAAELFILSLLACLWATFLFEKPDLPGGESDLARLKALRGGFRTVLIATVSYIFVAALIAATIRGVDAELMIVTLIPCGLTPTLWLIWRLKDGAGRPKRGPIEPFQVPFSRDGMGYIILATIAAVVLPTLIFWSSWLFFSLAAGAFLGAALWRAAVSPKRSFLWYGVAVFVSVPLFGTLTWMVQNVFEPQVQPMALIRKMGSTDEFLQGLFVTETDSRIYFASVSTVGCSKHLITGKGRLLSVPKSEVAAIAVGPLQSVTRARKSALEMSYALAPSTPLAANELAGPATIRRFSADDEPQGNRLENVSAAVEPQFGAGLKLVPEVATPGEVVTLKMSAPMEATRGFGRSRHHRTLRLDGIPVKVIKEQAKTPWEAEYVETTQGKTLKLGKQIAYTRSAGTYSAISRYEDPGERPLFVRISDRAAASVHDNGLASHGYLRLKREKDAPVRLAVEAGELPRVTLRNGVVVKLKEGLLRQAWHEDHIRFRLPEGSRSGVVTFDCDQLAGEPMLRVVRPPEARISVKIQPNSPRVLFDSAPSRDASGKILARHWTINGIDSGHSARLAETLLTSPQGYSVRLTIVDSRGQHSSASLKLFRIPAKLPHFHASGRVSNSASLEPVKAAIGHSMSVEAPESIEFDAHFAGSNAAVALRYAKGLRRDLLNSGAPLEARAPAGPRLTIRTIAYGSACAAADSGHNDRFDVLILGKGVQAVSPGSCPPTRVITTHQVLTPR